MSSRVTPARRAVFQPTVMDMSMLGAAAESGCVGEIQRSFQSSVPIVRYRHAGDVDCELTPPAIAASLMPAAMLAAANWTAARLAAQWRLTAAPGMAVSPAVRAAWRATTPPP